MPLLCSPFSARGDDWGSGITLREMWSLSQWDIHRVWSVVFLDVTLCRGPNRSRRFEEKSAFIFKAGRHCIHSKLYDLSMPLHSVTEILQIRSCTLYRMFEKTVKFLLRLNKKEKITNLGTSLFVLITLPPPHTHTLHCFANRVKEGMMGGPYRIRAGNSKCKQNFI